MCNARIEATLVDGEGQEFPSSMPCPDGQHLGDVCYFHLKVKHGLCEPCLPEYAKDARVFIGEQQIWPREGSRKGFAATETPKVEVA